MAGPYQIDLQRQVSAKLIAATDPSCNPVRGKWYAPPGSMQHVWNQDNTLYGFVIACPGCGLMKSFVTCDRGPADGNRRDMKGKPHDASTLSLSGRIVNSCCGWVGVLHKGRFVPLPGES